MNPNYPNTPKPLGTSNDNTTSGIQKSTKIFILFFIFICGLSVFMNWLEYNSSSDWALEEGKQASFYAADISGKSIENSALIDDDDIIRGSDGSIYIQRSALVAEKSYIYIPEWKVKILKPDIENFSYAFNGEDKLYIWGNIENTYYDADAQVPGKITDNEGQIKPAAYLGMIIKSNKEDSRNSLSVFDIDEDEYLYYIENADLKQYYQGNYYYSANLRNTLQELNYHFTDFKTYQKFE